LKIERSVRTTSFKKQFDQLPPSIQALSRAAFKRFRKNPHDPVLENEQLYDSKKGRHRKGSRSVVITRRYRSIYVVDTKDKSGKVTAVWYWTGSHEDYNNFIG
jgi:hypothetical protein